MRKYVRFTLTKNQYKQVSELAKEAKRDGFAIFGQILLLQEAESKKDVGLVTAVLFSPEDTAELQKMIAEVPAGTQLPESITIPNGI